MAKAKTESYQDSGLLINDVKKDIGNPLFQSMNKSNDFLILDSIFNSFEYLL